jgi:lipopolysaccharide/colanic/teichoic acid biosynthesis glycosyltransferase
VADAESVTQVRINSLSLIDLGTRADHIATRVYYAIKRSLDVLIAVALLLTLSWLLVLIAVAVGLESGYPVLFEQVRIGRRGKPFRMLKFRTMRPERRVSKQGPPQGTAERRRRHKSPGDPRVTRVGRLLRRTCFDELPQLLNVLRGEMSLVGPRPELPEIVDDYAPWQHARHLVTPGITGWWQVNRDGNLLMHEATHLDLEYIRDQSLWLDVVILVRTIGAVIGGSGAF